MMKTLRKKVEPGSRGTQDELHTMVLDKTVPDEPIFGETFHMATAGADRGQE